LKGSETCSDADCLVEDAFHCGNQDTDGVRSKCTGVYMIAEEVAHFTLPGERSYVAFIFGAWPDVRGRRRLSYVPVAVLALAFTNLTVDSPKASALFDLLAPPLHVVCLGVVLP
jgi:hypothetical protein